MRPPRSRIPQRRRIFLCCEGESELGYSGVLRGFLNACGAHIHLDPVKLRGGDPLALIEDALSKLHERRRRHGNYEKHAVLLDDDKLGLKPDRDAKIRSLVETEQVTLLWQRPCHEALLLRHLSGCGHRHPASSADALAELRRHWPSYVKGLSAMEISKQIGDEQIRKAMTVEPALNDFLGSLGVR
jgi:hypothetical protein